MTFSNFPDWEQASREIRDPFAWFYVIVGVLTVFQFFSPAWARIRSKIWTFFKPMDQEDDADQEMPSWYSLAVYLTGRVLVIIFFGFVIYATRSHFIPDSRPVYSFQSPGGQIYYSEFPLLFGPVQQDLRPDSATLVIYPMSQFDRTNGLSTLQTVERTIQEYICRSIALVASNASCQHPDFTAIYDGQHRVSIRLREFQFRTLTYRGEKTVGVLHDWLEYCFAVGVCIWSIVSVTRGLRGIWIFGQATFQKVSMLRSA
jgi:hypothetical protein